MTIVITIVSMKRTDAPMTNVNACVIIHLTLARQVCACIVNVLDTLTLRALKRPIANEVLRIYTETNMLLQIRFKNVR